MCKTAGAKAARLEALEQVQNVLSRCGQEDKWSMDPEGGVFKG